MPITLQGLDLSTRSISLQAGNTPDQVAQFLVGLCYLGADTGTLVWG